MKQRKTLSNYAMTKAGIHAANILQVLMTTCEDGGGYASLYHAQQYLLANLPDYAGCTSDRYWIGRTFDWQTGLKLLLTGKTV